MAGANRKPGETAGAALLAAAAALVPVLAAAVLSSAAGADPHAAGSAAASLAVPAALSAFAWALLSSRSEAAFADDGEGASLEAAMADMAACSGVSEPGVDFSGTPGTCSYDPNSKEISLDAGLAGSAGPAACGCAAHEAGHHIGFERGGGAAGPAGMLLRAWRAAAVCGAAAVIVGLADACMGGGTGTMSAGLAALSAAGWLRAGIELRASADGFRAWEDSGWAERTGWRRPDMVAALAPAQATYLIPAVAPLMAIALALVLG